MMRSSRLWKLCCSLSTGVCVGCVDGNRLNAWIQSSYAEVQVCEGRTGLYLPRRCYDLQNVAALIFKFREVDVRLGGRGPLVSGGVCLGSRREAVLEEPNDDKEDRTSHRAAREMSQNGLRFPDQTIRT